MAERDYFPCIANYRRCFMPLSSTANYSCDVVKEGGNDNSHAGPFQTIQAAMAYLRNNFALDAQHKGVVNLAPGIYDAAADLINITGGEDQYIDFVGNGKDDTILRSNNTIPVIVNAADARNHFSNLTMEFNGPSGVPDFALNVMNCSDVLVEMCRIKSNRRCIDNFASNATMANCEITSTLTDPGTAVCTGIRGLVRDSQFTASSLGLNSTLVENYTGLLWKCRLSTISTLPTPVKVRCVNNLGGGVVSHCHFESQGLAFVVFQTGAIVEDSYFSSEGTGGDAVGDRFEDCTVRNCFFYQKANVSVIHRGAATSALTKVMDTTFYGPLCTGHVIGSLEIDNSRWEHCRFISADNATGYSLASTVLDKIAFVKDPIANRPIDPLIRLTDNGLAAKGMAEAKGFNQKRWWSIQANPTLLGMGISPTITAPGGSSPGQDNGGPYWLIQTNGLNTTASIAVTTPLIMRPGYHPKFYMKFRLSGTGVGPLPGARLWCGFFPTTPPGMSDTLGIPGICLGLSDFLGGTGGYHGVTSTGVAQTNSPQIQNADTNVHTLMMTVDDPTQVLYQLDSGQLFQSNTNLPPSTQNLGFWLQITQTQANQRGFALYAAWCEFDP
jgi:hypothetical protein